MISIGNTLVCGWEPAIRGLRNPMNSWEKSDSCEDAASPGGFHIGEADHDLMMRMNKTTSESKYRRMIAVWVDVVAPLYWWKEFDTYKIGTVRNSCSTMHKIQDKRFTLEDFSCAHLLGWDSAEHMTCCMKDGEVVLNNCLPKDNLQLTINMLNYYRESWQNEQNPESKKQYWWQMIQLLPSSYNQRSTLMLDYEVLAKQYRERKNHKLDEWHTYCGWIESLPYSEIITGGKE